MCLLLKKKNRVDFVFRFSLILTVIADIQHCFLSLGQQMNSSIMHFQQNSGYVERQFPLSLLSRDTVAVLSPKGLGHHLDIHMLVK